MSLFQKLKHFCNSLYLFLQSFFASDNLKKYEGFNTPKNVEPADYLIKEVNNTFLYFIEEQLYAIKRYPKNADKDVILKRFERDIKTSRSKDLSYTLKKEKSFAKAYWILRYKIPELKKEIKSLKESDNDDWIEKENQLEYIETRATKLIAAHIDSLWT